MPKYRVRIYEEAEYSDTIIADNEAAVREAVNNGEFELRKCTVNERYITELVEVNDTDKE